MKLFLDAGRAAFHRPQGQLNLAWQGLGPLQRRLRSCLVGMRAEPYEYGGPEGFDLELFLVWRARGMTIEAPAVRP